MASGRAGSIAFEMMDNHYIDLLLPMDYDYLKHADMTEDDKDDVLFDIMIFGRHWTSYSVLRATLPVVARPQTVRHLKLSKQINISKIMKKRSMSCISWQRMAS